MSDMADVLGELWDAGNCTGLDGWVGPGRGAGEVDSYALSTRDRDVAKAISALSAAGFGPVREARTRVLLDAAEALDLQPPKLKAQYVSTLRLYALEPWRLETKKGQ